LLAQALGWFGEVKVNNDDRATRTKRRGSKADRETNQFNAKEGIRHVSLAQSIRP